MLARDHRLRVVQRERRERDLRWGTSGERGKRRSDALERFALTGLVGVEQVLGLLLQMIDVGAGRRRP